MDMETVGEALRQFLSHLHLFLLVRAVKCILFEDGCNIYQQGKQTGFVLKSLLHEERGEDVAVEDVAQLDIVIVLPEGSKEVDTELGALPRDSEAP